MKRNYPLFTIDRSKHSAYPFDFITCYDKEVGFIAKAIPFFDKETYSEFVTITQKKLKNPDVLTINYEFKKGGLVLYIEDFLYYFEWNNQNTSRIKTLLKKALKKYIHAEVDRTAHDGLDIDDQIKQQELTIERAKQNYDDLVERAAGDKKYADYTIALAEATLETLKKYRDNFKYFNLN